MARRRKNSRHGTTSTQPIRDIKRGDELQFETVIEVTVEGRTQRRHVATAGLVEGALSGTYAWELGLVSKKRSGTVLKIRIPAYTPMVDLRTGERTKGLPVPFFVYKHKSRVREVE